MKFLICSDIHGSFYYCDKLIKAYQKEECDKLIILGDILYHGPRNDLPKDYNPKKVIEILNNISDEILCVRGNCDTEVDQMVLDFPILADYGVLYLSGRNIYLTHGHIYNPENPPKLKKGDVLINGHTHIPAFDYRENYLYINPGSVSIPKNDSTNSYIIYEDGNVIFKSIDGEIYRHEVIEL